MADERELTEYGMEEEMSTAQVKVIAFFKKNLYEIAIVIVCLARIVTGLAPVELSGKTVIEILGKSVLTIIFALLLARLLEEKGLSVGEKAEKYKREIEKYHEAEERAGKHLKWLDDWCKRYSQEEYQKTLSSMLFPLGITYEQYVKGEYDVRNFTKGQMVQFLKVKRKKMYIYTTEELMSGDLDYHSNTKCLQASKKRYRKRSVGSDLGSKIIIALVFGMLALPPIIEWDWSGMLWTVLETAVIFGFSVVKYFSAYTFVNEDLCAKVVCKTTILGRFLKDVEELENKENE